MSPGICWEVNAYDRKKIWVDNGDTLSVEWVEIMTADIASTSGTRLELKQDGSDEDGLSVTEHRASHLAQYYLIYVDFVLDSIGTEEQHRCLVLWTYCGFWGKTGSRENPSNENKILGHLMLLKT